MVLQLNQRHAKVVSDLERNQVETQQVLEAAEHLEQNNAASLEKSAKLEAQNAELMQRVADLEAEREQKDLQIQSLQQASVRSNNPLSSSMQQ